LLHIFSKFCSSAQIFRCEILPSKLIQIFFWLPNTFFLFWVCRQQMNYCINCVFVFLHSLRKILKMDHIGEHIDQYQIYGKTIIQNFEFTELQGIESFINFSTGFG